VFVFVPIDRAFRSLLTVWSWQLQRGEVGVGVHLARFETLPASRPRYPARGLGRQRSNGLAS